MDYLSDQLGTAWVQLQLAAWVFCAGLVLESLRPAERHQPLGHIAFNIGFTAYFVVVTALVMPPIQALTQGIATRLAIGIPLHLPDGIAGQILQALAFLFVFDFFYYWFHRAQHRFGPLWAQHKVHHADASLNVTTTNRHNVLEEPLRAFLVLLPIGVLFDMKPITLGWIWLAISVWGYLIHMNVRIELGPLSWVVTNPQVHRIHHSRLPGHRDRNFAVFFPVLDVLFGTWYRPARGEFPPTGLDTGEDLNHWWRATVAPFADWGRRLARLTGSRSR